MEIDLHGYHHSTIREGDLIAKVLRQAWEMGESELVIIHGHGKSRGTPRIFANTNTGYLGLTVRSLLRNDRRLRQWMRVRLDVSKEGSTKIRLKKNPNPTSSASDRDVLPEPDFDR